jgi:hypothetical protein
MTSRAPLATLLAVALLALPHPAAAADRAVGAAVSPSAPKDYSRNSVTGEYVIPNRRRAAGGEIRTSSLAGTTAPPAAGRTRPARVDNPWPELAIGFVGGLLVAGSAVGIAGRTRRARVAV